MALNRTRNILVGTFLCLITTMLLPIDGLATNMTYAPYSNSVSPTTLPIKLSGPNLVGKQGVRSYRMGKVHVYFVQNAENGRYKWFDEEDKRVWLVKQLTRITYEAPSILLQNLDNDTINYVIYPAGVELDSNMGGSVWHEGVFARASQFRIELKEYWLADWEHNESPIKYVIMHELAHLLSSGPGTEFRIEDSTVDVENHELGADIYALLWWNISEKKIKIPKSKKDYQKQFEIQAAHLIESHKKRNTGKDHDGLGISNHISSREDPRTPFDLDTHIWGYHSYSLGDDVYGPYNLMVKLMVSDGSTQWYLADGNTRKYTIFNNAAYEEAITKHRPSAMAGLDSEVFKSIINSEEHFTSQMLFSRYIRIPEILNIGNKQWEIRFTCPLLHDDPALPRFVFRYMVEDNNFSYLNTVGRYIGYEKEVLVGQ